MAEVETRMYGAISPHSATLAAHNILAQATASTVFEKFRKVRSPPMFTQKTSKKRGERRVYEVWQNGRRIATFHTSQARREWIQTTTMLAHPE